MRPVICMRYSLSKQGWMMMNQHEMTNKADALAREVLTLSRSTLLVNLRFLDGALNQIALAPASGERFATDGRTLYYNARHVLRTYREERTAPVRDYLHLVLHCVFRHMYTQESVKHDIWDLACDMAVEHTIAELGLPVLSAGREQRQRKAFVRLCGESGAASAEKIYRTLLRKQLPLEEFQDLRSIFFADDHQLWYAERGDRAEGEAAWKAASRRMQVDMETFAKRQGAKAGALMQNLRAANREACDYAGFLRKFAARNEPMKLDPDEFDYIFYTYGMKLYQKMPLIEPLEYKQRTSVREFVIALDTTETFPDELTHMFLQETCRVLKATESFCTKVHLYILPCGGTQESVKITGQADLDEYLNCGKLRSAGGTDFRPVFRRIDEMIQDRAFENLRGLIYFTDGYGPFPADRPDYETAFIFVNDDYSVPDVPSWAIRLVLQQEEITQGKGGDDGA